MYLTMYFIERHLREIAAIIHQAPDPGGAAQWCVQEIADRTGLRVLVAAHYLAPSERLRQAGAEVLDALRTGLALPKEGDVEATQAAARALLANLQEEVEAFEMSEDYTGGEVEYLVDAWGPLVPPG